MTKKAVRPSLILTDDVRGLGVVGDMVQAKSGYGRYLNRVYRALFATTENKKIFLDKQDLLIQEAHKKRQEAQELAIKLQDHVLNFRMMAGEGGKLFGVVSARTIAKELNHEGFPAIKVHHIILNRPFSNTGRYIVRVGFEGADATLEVNIISTSAAAMEQNAVV